MQYLGVFFGNALPYIRYCLREWECTERSVVEKDDVVKCVFESFMIGPDFAHGRLEIINLTQFGRKKGRFTLFLW